MKITARKLPRTGGITVVEAVITLAVFGTVLGSLGLVLTAAGGTFRSGSTAMTLEVKGSRAVADLVDTLRTADLVSLAAVPAAPFSTSEINFQQNLGFEDTESAWSDPQRIRFDPVAGEVVWIENPTLPGERTIKRRRSVAPLLEGEVVNGLDDNANGLIDEPGFCLTREDDLLTIYLTLEDRDAAAGAPALRTWTTRLYCRN